MKNVIDRLSDALDNLTGASAKQSDEERRLAAARRAAERLLKRRDQKRRSWHGHWQTWLVVNAGLWLLTAFEHVSNPRSMAIVSVSWAVALALHGLGTRRWFDENRGSLASAERLLGHAPAVAPAPPVSSAWADRVERCRKAVAATDAVLGDLELKGANVAEARTQLLTGLVGLEDLARGGERIELAIQSVAPGGALALDAELQSLRAKAAAAGDERLRQAHARNAELLEDRKHKLARLEAEVERLRVSLDGYVLLADNVRLDAARLGAGNLGKIAVDLKGPMAELQEQIDLVRAVEAELD